MLHTYLIQWDDLYLLHLRVNCNIRERFNILRQRQNGRRHFQIHFLLSKLLYLDTNFTEICSQGSSWQEASIDSDNGLALNRWQAIIGTNISRVCRRIYLSLGLNELAVTTAHDDVIKRKHFPRYWPFVRGIHWWIPRTKASDAELWCFLWSAPK